MNQSFAPLFFLLYLPKSKRPTYELPKTFLFPATLGAQCKQRNSAVCISPSPSPCTPSIILRTLFDSFFSAVFCFVSMFRFLSYLFFLYFYRVYIYHVREIDFLLENFFFLLFFIQHSRLSMFARAFPALSLVN